MALLCHSGIKRRPYRPTKSPPLNTQWLPVNSLHCPTPRGCSHATADWLWRDVRVKSLGRVNCGFRYDKAPAPLIRCLSGVVSGSPNLSVLQWSFSRGFCVCVCVIFSFFCCFLFVLFCFGVFCFFIFCSGVLKPDSLVPVQKSIIVKGKKLPCLWFSLIQTLQLTQCTWESRKRAGVFYA